MFNWKSFSSYSYDAKRFERSYEIKVRDYADANRLWDERGMYVVKQTTSQFTYPGKWTWLVYHWGEFKPLLCTCPDFVLRGFDGFACKHILAVLRALGADPVTHAPDTPTGVGIWCPPVKSEWMLYWNPVPGATAYFIYEKAGAARPFVHKWTVSFTRVHFHKRGFGAYWFAVKACNRFGCSPMSASAYAWMQPYNESGSPPPEKPSPDTTPVKTVPDPGLGTGIRIALPKPSGPILSSDLEHLTSLTADNKNVRSLEGLQYAVNLYDLHLGVNQITNIEPLANLPKLTVLDLYSNEVSDLSPLSNDTSLEQLDIRRNNVFDLDPLTHLSKLARLDASYNQIADLSPLRDIPHIDHLICDNNQIRSVEPLKSWYGQRTLDLHDNQISDLSPLLTNARFKSGSTFNVSSNPLNFYTLDEVFPKLRAAGIKITLEDKGLVSLYEEVEGKHTYRLTWRQGKVYSWIYYASAIKGASVTGEARRKGWRVSSWTSNHVFFETDTPMTSGAITGFVIDHPEGGQIRAVCEGLAVIAYESSFVAPPVLPEAPTGLSIEPYEVAPWYVLRWNAVDGAINYQVQGWDAINGWLDLFTVTNPICYPYIPFNGEYKFRVKACNDAGCSDWSAELSFTKGVI